MTVVHECTHVRVHTHTCVCVGNLEWRRFIKSRSPFLGNFYRRVEERIPKEIFLLVYQDSKTVLRIDVVSWSFDCDVAVENKFPVIR